MGGFAIGKIHTNTGSAVGAAENGLSVINPAPGDYRVVLGQDVGQAGDPGELLSNREIPTNAFALSLKNGTSTSFMDGNSISLFGDSTTLKQPALFLVDANDPGGHFWFIIISSFSHYISSWANARGNLIYTENPTSSTGEVLISSSQAAVSVNAKVLIEELSSSPFDTDYEVLRLFSTMQFDNTLAAHTSYGVRSVIASTRGAGANNLTNIAGYFNATGAQFNYGVVVDGGLSGFLASAPRAVLHVGPGTALRPPIIIDSGINVTTPVAGAIENNGVNLFFTPSASRLLIGLFSTGSLVVGRVLFGDTSNMINQNANFVYSSANNCMGLGGGTTSAGTYLNFAANSTTKSAYRYTAGSLVASPANGDKEFDGTNEYITAATVRYTLAKTLTATAVLDFPNTATMAFSTLTIAVTGAADGDPCIVSPPIAAQTPGAVYTAFVSAAGVVTVQFFNGDAAAQDPASATFRVSVLKYT